MMILVVWTSIVSLWAWWAVREVSAQGEVHFEYLTIDASDRNTLNFRYNASLDATAHVLKVTDPTDPWCSSRTCRGQIVYSTAIDFIDRPSKRTYSFSTSFVFTLTIPRSGEGFVFFIISNPYDDSNNGLGDYFGAFPSQGQATFPTIAVEFDTLKNPLVYDIDDNHVGVDINKAESAMAVSCSKVQVQLYAGARIVAWIDYHDSFKSLEVRLANYSQNVVRPDSPLLDMSLDLTPLVDDKMYAGFSGSTYNGQEQEIAIYSWTFDSKLEAPAPPLPPRGPLGVIGNTSGPDRNPWINVPPTNSSRNSTGMIVIGACVGGGLGLILALAACFCCGLYCSRRLLSAEAARLKEEADDHERSKADEAAYAPYAGDAEDDVASRRDGEGGGGGGGEERGDRLLAEMEEGGDTDYLTKRGRSMRIIQAKDVDDPTFLALRKGSDEFHNRPKRAKSARELEGDGVEAEAIRRGILEIEGVAASVVTPTFRRRSLSFSIPLAEEVSVDSATPLADVPPTALSPRGSISLHEQESAAAADDDDDSPQGATDYSPDDVLVASPGRGEEEVEILNELPGTDLADEESGGVVSPEAGAPPEGSTGDWYGRHDHHVDTGTSETVYTISATPNPSIANAARRSNSWSLWHSEPGDTAPAPEEEGTPEVTVYKISSTPSASIAHAAKRSNSWSPWNSEEGPGPQGRRQSSPVAFRPPPPAVEIKRRSSWSPWTSSGPTRQVQVVVKRSEAISPRQISDSPRRNQITSTFREVDGLPGLGVEVPSSAMAGAIMYTNTLYDLNPEEPHEESSHYIPSQSPSRPREDPSYMMMDDEIYVRPTVENIYDRPPVHSEYREQIVERIFDVEFSKEDDDVDRIFDVPETQQPHREILITSVIPSPASTPIPSHAGSKMPSRAASPAPSRAASRSASPRPSPAGTNTSSPARTSGSSSTDTAKESEQRRDKLGQNPIGERPHWRY